MKQEHGNAPGHMAGPVHHGQVAVMRARTHCACPAPRTPRRRTPRPAPRPARRATIPWPLQNIANSLAAVTILNLIYETLFILS